jgi:hypothetical protein
MADERSTAASAATRSRPGSATRLSLLAAGLARTLLAAVVFFGVLTPFALVRRLFGRSELSLRLERDRASYWQSCEPATPPSLRDQY